MNPSRGITIVIPAYNEAKRLGPTLDRVLDFVRQQAWDAEVIVVDDGSRDGTADLVEAYARKNEIVRLVQNPGNRGKGYSVRNGVLNAQGAIVLFTDADLSSPIEEAPKLLMQRQPMLCQVLGRAFNQLLRVILRLEFKDTQCGFKAFWRGAATALFPLQRIEGWGFDPEIFFLARRAALKVVEVPVRWSHDSGTRIHPLADGFRMVMDMLRIRWYAATGKYGGLSVRASSGVLPDGQLPQSWKVD